MVYTITPELINTVTKLLSDKAAIIAFIIVIQMESF